MKRVAALFLVILLAASGLTAFASERSEIIDITYVPIKGSKFVVDSLNGVDAIYSSKKTYYCIELVQRYYRQVYGVSVNGNSKGPSVSTKGYYFEKTTEPKPGDVIYSPAKLRGTSYNHWALVKKYENGVITIIEQNWKYSGRAAYERKIPFPSKYNYVYTLRGPGVDAKKAAAVKAEPVKVQNPLSDWAAASVEKASQLGIAAYGDYASPVTRAEFCSLAVQTINAFSLSMQPVRGEFAFSDTDDEQIGIAYTLGLINGISDTEFGPNAKVTRESAAVILSRMADLLGVKGESAEFAPSDISEISDWAVDGVAAMYSLGVATGDGTAFKPAEQLTNEQAITMMMRFAECAEKVVPVIEG